MTFLPSIAAHHQISSSTIWLSCGLPVVNNYPGWLAELIHEHRLGIQVPPRDPEAFAACLMCLADDPSLLVSLGANSRNLAETNFSRRLLADLMAPDPKKCLFQVLSRCRDYQRKQFYIFIKEIADRLASLVAFVVAFATDVDSGSACALAPRISCFFLSKAPRLPRQGFLVDQIPYYA